MAQSKTRFVLPEGNGFYRNHYAHILMGLMLLIVLLAGMVGLVLYQIFHRPLPTFVAKQANGQQMQLTPFEAPNLLADTILRWCIKAATVSYTFNFYNYREQINAARPYFTADGWADYQSSVSKLISTIVQNQLFVNGVVAGAPVISNEGPLPGFDYVWRVQIPFLVTYQSANVTTQRNFYVILTLVRVPTHINPQGIGIDQFVMVNR